MDMAKGNGNRRGALKGVSGRAGEASYAKVLGGGVKASEEPGIPTGLELPYQGTEESESLRDFFGWLEAVRVDSWEGYENSRMEGSPCWQLIYSVIRLQAVHKVYAMAVELTGSIDIVKREQMARDAIARAMSDLQGVWPKKSEGIGREDLFMAISAAEKSSRKLVEYIAKDISEVLGNVDERE